MDLAKMDQTITREVIQRDQAVERFEAMGESYKAEIVARFQRLTVSQFISKGLFKIFVEDRTFPARAGSRHLS
ncbi:MAG: hypothetical protein CM1200mP41_31820 [Gammaproteobacteria bacterium]|nr:MAG: hypothetical protein CM1200mP41_31820 [Gammaproteobacteria bacterium]